MEQPCARLCTRREAGANLRRGQSVRTPGVPGDEVWEWLGEGPSWAGLAQAAEPADTKTQTDRSVADG